MSTNQGGRPRTINPERVSLIALRLFDDGDYDSVSMDDVARTAGISRRHLFHLFPSKASLVWGGLDEFIVRFRNSLDGSPESIPPEHALATAYEVAATFPDDGIEVTRHRLRVIAEHPTLASEGASRVAALTTYIAGFLSQRRKLDPTDLRVTVTANAITSGASAALTWWAVHSDAAPAEIVTAGIRIVMDGAEQHP